MAAETPPPKHSGELFTRCRRQYGLTPEEVLGLLEVADADALLSYFADYGEVLELIEHRLVLRGGRELRPEASQAALEKEIERAERRGWDAAKRFRFQELGHWAEMWASLAKISGKPRRNPFAAVAALGRTRGHRGEGG